MLEKGLMRWRAKTDRWMYWNVWDGMRGTRSG